MREWPFKNEPFRRQVRVCSLDQGRDYYITESGIIPDQLDGSLTYNTVTEYETALANAKRLILEGVFGVNCYLDGIDVTEEIIDGKRLLLGWPPDCEEAFGLLA